MSRLWSLLFVVAAACGGSSKPAPQAPLPADPAPVADKEPPPPDPEDAEAGEAAPPVAGPLDVTVEPPVVAVKLVSAGKGTKAPLRYAPTAGAKQAIEIAMDFTQKHTAPAELGGPGQQGSPTIVLTGEAETTAVDPAGKAAFVLTVSGVDARDVPGAPPDSSVPAEKLRAALQGVKGMTIKGDLGADGTVGALALHLDRGDGLGKQVMEMMQLSMPSWAVLPREPIGVGAKWTTTRDSTVLGKLPITIVTTYELVSRKGAAWTVKGAIAISGKDQQVEQGSITGIKGTGTAELAATAGALYPTIKTSQTTEFTATEGGQAIQLSLLTAGTVGAPAPAPTK